jgi:hypothetical protein
MRYLRFIPYLFLSAYGFATPMNFVRHVEWPPALLYVTSHYPVGWREKVHQEPSLTSPLVKLRDSKEELINDEDRIYVESPNVIEVTGVTKPINFEAKSISFQDNKVVLKGLDPTGAAKDVMLRVGDKFESSEDGVFDQGGGDCLVRFQNVMIHVDDCLWTQGFNPALQQNFKFPKYPEPDIRGNELWPNPKEHGNYELWHRLVHGNHQIVGWILHDWELGD